MKPLVRTLHPRISVCKRDNVEYIHEEHFAEHYKVLNREAKDTVNAINKQEKRQKNNNTKIEVCAVMWGRRHALLCSCVCVFTIVPVPL